MNRNARYSDIVPRSIIDTKIRIIGVGAIGKQVATQLASIGFRNLVLQDMDVVDESNCGTQGFCPGDIGFKKVDIVRNLCLSLNPKAVIEAIDTEFNNNSTANDSVVFMCVDSMSAREMIYEAINPSETTIIDTRMNALSANLIAIKQGSGYDYMDTWYPDSEAQEGRCTARSTLFCANIIASYSIWALIQIINKSYSKDYVHLYISLLNNEIMEKEIKRNEPDRD